MSNKAAFKAVVCGRVQGVSYRYFVQRRAEAIGLTGYTKNLRDGSVEVVAEGEREQLEQLIVRLKVGPRDARVDQVDVNWSDYSGKYDGFDIVF
jgi:acylphosphatase